MIPFSRASFRSQVHRLRACALAALRSYRLRVESLEFIQHGENATWKVITRSRSYLLRIHRAGYHTRAALLEELAWIEHLGEPKPVRSLEGSLLVLVDAPGLDEPRFCDLLEWTDGRILGKSVRPAHLESIGRRLAELQMDGARRKIRHRQYWTPDGILGDESKFGSVYSLMDVNRREQSRITGAARELLAELRAYGRREPSKQGLIHADLHFGNAVFRSGGELSVIDFDDCGHGFYMYDLCAPLLSVDNVKRRLRPDLNVEELFAALIEGYASLKDVSAGDLEMIKLFKVARAIQMTGWLNSRASNPRLRELLRGSVDRALAAIKTLS